MERKLVKLILSDKKSIEVSDGSTILDAVKGDKRVICGIRPDGTFVDIREPLHKDEEIELIYKDDPRALYVLRHSCAHLMADAVKSLFKGSKLGIGPSIEDGFYYDIDTPRPLTDKDLSKIEQEMRKIQKRNHSFERIELDPDEAKRLFKNMGEDYKLELIEDITSRNEKITLFKHGEFTDLCRGPHLHNTSQIRHFKLLKVAGAYWRGDEKKPMLQRIYGTAFFTKEQLDDYLTRLKEAEKRDHRLLGKQLDLFSIDNEIGPGLILWHPKGAMVRHLIETYWKRQHLLNGYELLYTPHIARSGLWETSGHLGFYSENMFDPMDVDGIDYLVKPMNCPFHIKIYKSKIRSYRDLPIRWAELGTVYRYERSGVLHGLLRVRGFTQDDAHIFVTPEGLEEEIFGVLRFSFDMLKVFGFEEFEVFLSTRPEKYVGTLKNWEAAEAALKHALEKLSVNYSIDPGEGVFYGPKIDIKIKDSLKRVWQCSTIQVDFNLPERFGVLYQSKNGEMVAPVMIHRALLGSIERFFGVLLEHYAGDLPLWLAPVQVIVIPISEKFLSPAKKIVDQLKKEEIRVTLDSRDEKLGYKIRDAELKKIPVMVIIGAKEVESGKMSVRFRKAKEDKGNMDIKELIALVRSDYPADLIY